MSSIALDKAKTDHIHCNLPRLGLKGKRLTTGIFGNGRGVWRISLRKTLSKASMSFVCGDWRMNSREVYIPKDPCMVYLLTFTIKSQPKVGKYTIHGSYGIWNAFRVFWLKTGGPERIFNLLELPLVFSIHFLHPYWIEKLSNVEPLEPWKRMRLTYESVWN